MNILYTVFLKDNKAENSYITEIGDMPVSFGQLIDLVKDDIMSNADDECMISKLIQAINEKAPCFMFDEKKLIVQFHITESIYMDWRIIDIPNDVFEMIKSAAE